MKGSLSFVLPVLNDAAVIEECLESLISLDIPDLEIICVDGGSSDGSTEIINKAVCEDSRIFLLRLHSVSCGYLLNQGMARAKKKYVAFLRPDNNAYRNIYAKYIAIAEENNLDMIQSAVGVVNDFTDGICEHVFSSKQEFSWSSMTYSVSAGIYRRKFLVKNVINFCEMQNIVIPSLSFNFKSFLCAERTYICNDLECQMEKGLNKCPSCNIVAEFEYMYKALSRVFSEQRKKKQWGRILAKKFCQEIYGMLSHLPKAEIRKLAEKSSNFLWQLQTDNMIDLRRFMREDGQALMQLLYNVDEYCEDVLQGETPRMDMEFMFPYHMFPEGSRVVIYGAGNVGRLIYRQAIHDGYVSIVGIVDKHYDRMSAPDILVQPVEQLFRIKYDFVFIAIRESKIAYDVRKNLERLGIPAEKIKWDGMAIFRDDFYRNLYFPILKKAEGFYADHETFLNKIQVKHNKNNTKDESINYGYYDDIKPIVESIPESNGSRYYNKIDKVIGWITDPFAYNAYAGTASSIIINPDDWMEKIEKIDLLFIVTGWRGFHDEWIGFAHPGSKVQKLICKIVEACNNRNIPTVFYSKEDPVSYDSYLPIAKKCKFLFTSAVEMIPKYVRDCGHERVGCLNFCINPQLHNPIGTFDLKKKSEVLFSGSWYKIYVERCKETKCIFDEVLKSGMFLRIIDRHLLLTKYADRFPEKYKAFVVPPVEHKYLQKVHKLYDWAININTVKNSMTMFAARAYELSAVGNLLLSNYSVGVNNKLPNVFICQKPEEIPSIINSFTPEEIYQRQMAGVRFAYRNNTCYERMYELLNFIGIDVKIPKYRVAVLVKENDENCRLMAERQSYEIKDVITEKELNNRYKEYDIIAFFKEGRYYGDFYLEDMINAFKYTHSDYITKDGYYCGAKYIGGKEHDYVSVMPDKYRTVFWAKSFTAEKLIKMEKNVSLPNGYSIDHLMYNEKMLKKEKSKVKPLLSVIVPIYNNGIYLYGKAFNSLRRSSIFERMEILLIDDGSTDAYTKAIVRALDYNYPNVRTYFFEEGGSGSAARPRNYGMDIAEADYITFVDPDDEAVNDGYAKMVKIAEDKGSDIVFGNMAMLNEQEYVFHFYDWIGKEDFNGGRKTLGELRYRPINMQTMIIRKSMLKTHRLKQIEGGLGEDTFFSYQLIFNAKTISAVPFIVYIYYGLREGSCTNAVDEMFFVKSLKTEQNIIKWLRKNDLLDDYMKRRFNSFFKGWYLEKLKIAKGSIEKCSLLISRIFALYKKYYDYGDEEINKFIK